MPSQKHIGLLLVACIIVLVQLGQFAFKPKNGYGSSYRQQQFASLEYEGIDRKSTRIVYGKSLVETTKPFRILPKSQTKRVWDCTAIPAWQKLCSHPSNNNNTTTTIPKNAITLEALLTPPTEIPVWERPKSVKQAFEDLVQLIFKPFPTITTGDLDALMTDPSCGQSFKFKIDQGHVYVAVPKIAPTKRGFASQRKLHPLRNLQTMADLNLLNITYMEAVICTGDNPPNGPGLSLAWNTQYKENDPYGIRAKGIPMPLMEWLTLLDEWDDYMNETFHWREKFPWKNRTRKAVFRGGARTCNPDRGDELAQEVHHNVSWEVPCGRRGLMKMSQNLTNTTDVALGSSHISMPDQEKFTMVLLAEGHYGWANRLGTLLAMENVVIRQFNNPFEEWYYAWLEPFVHYVPVDHLWNYLPGVLEWCLGNDDMIRQISRNADEFAKTFLSVETQLQLIRAEVEEYERRFQPEQNPQNKEKWLLLDDVEKTSYALLHTEEYIQARWPGYIKKTKLMSAVDQEPTGQ